ncbi:hypothetical protein EV182_000045 [Spiromyces aspiralis]|uniref:Uncharacterized protein n=1 Tax=Spiromyces aspiralis TaxID=68401 RepID=A0ACC1HIK5_9FUNG|nr:hypothetical protein EV182_000045 [Spiromyces aspiralis]
MYSTSSSGTTPRAKPRGSLAALGFSKDSGLATGEASVGSGYSSVRLSTATASIRRSVLSMLSGHSDDAIVLDVGNWAIRAGFAGDSRPACIVRVCPSVRFGCVSCEGEDKLRVIWSGNEGISEAPWVADDPDRLESLLCHVLSEIYSRHLLTDSKVRKVIVVESPLLSIPFKRALARAILDYMRVPAITWFPASAMSLLTTGSTTGLVIDCGHTETTVVPVFEGTPLFSYMASTPLAGKALRDTLRGLLLAHATYRIVGRSISASQSGRQQGQQALHPSLLTPELLQRIQTTLLVACPWSPQYSSHELFDEDSINEWYQTNSNVSTLTISTRLTTDIALRVLSRDQLSLISASDLSSLRAKVTIPGWVRDRAVDTLFNGDTVGDRPGIIPTALEAIARSPVDIRRRLVGTLVVVGGAADMPQFRVAVLQKLVRLLRNDPRWKALADDVKLAEENTDGSGYLFQPSLRPWVGGSLAGSARIEGLHSSTSSGAGGQQSSAVPDWSYPVTSAATNATTV